MSKTNSFTTMAPSNSKSLFSPLMASSYHVSTSLTPFFAIQPNKKDVKPERKEIIGCMRCSFIKHLLNLCNGAKIRNRNHKKIGVGTQISTDQEIDRGTFHFIQNEEGFEEKKRNIIEFIEESKEISSQSLLQIKDSIDMRSTSNISCTTDIMKKSKNFTNYPLNEMFLFRNEENGEVFLTKIYMERGQIKKGRSFENFEELSNEVIQKEKMKKCISFIGDNNLEVGTSKILGNFLQCGKKNLILDVSSDFNVLMQVFFQF